MEGGEATAPQVHGDREGGQVCNTRGQWERGRDKSMQPNHTWSSLNMEAKPRHPRTVSHGTHTYINACLPWRPIWARRSWFPLGALENRYFGQIQSHFLERLGHAMGWEQIGRLTPYSPGTRQRPVGPCHPRGKNKRVMNRKQHQFLQHLSILKAIQAQARC